MNKYKIKYIYLKNIVSSLINNNQLNIDDYNTEYNKKNILNNENRFDNIGDNNTIYRNLSDDEKINDNNIYTDNIYGVWNKLPDELYVIGDIHGDFFALKQSLELTGCIDFDPYNEKLKYDDVNNLYKLNDGCDYYSVGSNVRWNKYKKNVYIVFAGDIIDRCRPDMLDNCYNTINDENCDYKILKLLFDLNQEANKYNSKIIIVLGNHELLNLQSELKYVSDKGKNDTNRLNNINNLINKNINNIYGIVRINRYIIVHGGINDSYFTEINLLYPNEDLESIEKFNKYLRENLKSENNTLMNNNSPFWDRTLAGVNKLNKEQCKNIFDKNILNIKPVNYYKIIVAHCPQYINNKYINLNNCDEYINRIYKIDIGMSRAFDSYKFNEELLLILNDINSENILSKDYKYFFNSLLNKNRTVSLLKLTNNREAIIFGQLSVEYFYNTVFKYKEDIFLYILSDLKKIIIENIKSKNNIDILNKCLSKIDLLIDKLTKLGK